ncbi:hypothetical protein DV735_g5818, partial [Chaetothyriales sp. CBS 134920]
MNQTILGHRLAAVESAFLQRFQNERLVYTLGHDPCRAFAARRSGPDQGTGDEHIQAHQAGCTTLCSSSCGGFLASGGADASIRFWDLQNSFREATVISPLAALTKAEARAHTRSITSLSIYPFDPTPSTILSTAFDKTLLLTQIGPSSLTPLHSFPLDYAPYCHATSPIPSPQPLVAVGAAHPAIRLLDLRSGHSIHSLPGHNGTVYTLSWSPRIEHVLVSGASDGRVLFFDIRRANAAFASLDLDDAIGVGPGNIKHPSQLLDFSARAHNGAVNSVQFTSNLSADRLVTTGHDQRIRVWDLGNGRNELVHFGPRIRNARQMQLAPLLTPPGTVTKPSREALLWPNDESKGEIHMHSFREGQLLRVLKMEGLKRNQDGKASDKFLGKGRINQIVWRMGDSSEGIEVLSAHGDGSIAVWRSLDDEDGSQEAEHEAGAEAADASVSKQIEELEKKRKRKRELLEGLVDGLSKKPGRSADDDDGLSKKLGQYNGTSKKLSR